MKNASPTIRLRYECERKCLIANSYTAGRPPSTTSAVSVTKLAPPQKAEGAAIISGEATRLASVVTTAHCRRFGNCPLPTAVLINVRGQSACECMRFHPNLLWCRIERKLAGGREDRPLSITVRRISCARHHSGCRHHVHDLASSRFP